MATEQEERTAQQAYEENKRAIFTALQKIEWAIEAGLPEEIDWRHVGDLAHIRGMLLRAISAAEKT